MRSARLADGADDRSLLELVDGADARSLLELADGADDRSPLELVDGADVRLLLELIDGADDRSRSIRRWGGRSLAAREPHVLRSGDGRWSSGRIG